MLTENLLATWKTVEMEMSIAITDSKTQTANYSCKRVDQSSFATKSFMLIGDSSSVNFRVMSAQIAFSDALSSQHLPS